MACLNDDLDEVFKGEYSLEERAELLRDVIQRSGIWDPSNVSYNDIMGKRGGTLYLLPDCWGNKTKQPILSLNDDFLADFFRTSDYSIFRLSQGTMRISPLSENPIFFTSMSECSTIIGLGKDAIYCAHISYSEQDETDAVLDFLRKRGINNITAIVSISDKEKRVASREAYEMCGISPERIIVFKCTSEPEEGLYRGISQVLATRQFIHKFSFDAKDQRRVSDYRESVTLATGL